MSHDPRKLAEAVLLGIALAVGGCTAVEPESGSEAATGDALGTVDYRVRASSKPLTLGTPIEDEVSYGECEEAKPSDDGNDWTIRCTQPWSEVAWYRLPADVVGKHTTTNRHLTVRFSLPRGGPPVRASILREQADGKRSKLVSLPTLLDGDAIEVELDEIATYDVYVARGESLIPLWSTGKMSFTATASIDVTSSTAPPN